MGAASRSHQGHGPLRLVIIAIAVYGGYFGTGIGVLFFAALGVFVDDTAPRLNATKQMLALVCNGVAGVLFAFVAPVYWTAAAALAVGSARGRTDRGPPVAAHLGPRPASRGVHGRCGGRRLPGRQAVVPTAPARVATRTQLTAGRDRARLRQPCSRRRSRACSRTSCACWPAPWPSRWAWPS